MTLPVQLTDSRKLLEVLRITQSLTAEVNLDALLGKIMDAARELLDAERSTLYLLDRERNELVSKIVHAEAGEIRLPIGTGIAGQVAETGEVIHVQDAYSDSRFHQDVDRRTGFRTRDLLTVPIRNTRHDLMGVIQVINRRHGRFDYDDQMLLQAMASSAGVALENARLYERIEIMLQSFMHTLAASIDARDPQTAGHSVRVGGYAGKLAQELKLAGSHQKLIYLAGLLHDYGKIGVPEAILTKAGQLTGDEMQVMRHHATMSREILQNVQFTAELNRIPDIVYQHHERMDGGGYPNGLLGHEITLEGRILAVCDVFDALTRRRYYREPISDADAFAYIRDNRGTHFDPEIVDAFGAILRREGHVTEWQPLEEDAFAAALAADRSGRL